MVINEELLQKLEKLSALKISDGKRDEISKQLSEIVNFIEVLNEIDLSKVEATVSTVNGGTPLREDISKNSDVIDIILKNAPSAENGCFVVPKILE